MQSGSEILPWLRRVDERSRDHLDWNNRADQSTPRAPSNGGHEKNRSARRWALLGAASTAIWLGACGQVLGLGDFKDAVDAAHGATDGSAGTGSIDASPDAADADAWQSLPVLQGLRRWPGLQRDGNLRRGPLQERNAGVQQSGPGALSSRLPGKRGLAPVLREGP